MTVVKADPKVIFDEILDLNLSECAVTVCLASCPKDEVVPRYERLQLSESLTEEFRSVATFLIEQCKKDVGNGNLLLREYVVESKPDSYEIEHLDLSAYDTIQAQLEPLAALADLEVFNEDQKFIASLRFYVIELQPPNGDSIHFFRSYTPKKMLGRSRMFAMWFNEGIYDRVSAPVFLFDHYVDSICRSGIMYIFKKDNFQESFRFFELVRRVARETLVTIKTHIPINNFETFARDCENHLPKLVKLRNIASKPYLGKLSMENIKYVIERNKLPVQIVLTDGKEMLAYDPANKWILLKLLDDDYLWSLMTEQSYEVTGKRELEQ